MDPPSTRQPRGPAGLLALPDDLIIRCLQCLSQHERFQHAALVSKRFQRLCLAPQLLRTVTFDVKAADWVRCCDSLLEFLMQNGECVHSLQIGLFGGFYMPEAQCQEAAGLVTACLTACGAVGKLEELCVSIHTPVASTARLARLTACRQLRLGHFDRPLRLLPSFGRLTALTDAELTGTPIELGTAASLPPALTRLRLRDSSATTLPRQLTSLSALARLDLLYGQYDADSLAMLARSPALRQLSLTPTGRLPASLSTITQLERLIVSSHNGGATAVLVAALPNLSGLTSLALELAAPLDSLAAVAQLPRLQRLLMKGDIDEEATAAELQLPPGPWLRSIRWLGLPWPALEPGADALRGAPQLEYIFSDGEPQVVRPDDWRSFWQFVATHPPLRCLAFAPMGGEEEGPVPLKLVDALLGLHECRPELRVRKLKEAWGFAGDESTFLF